MAGCTGASKQIICSLGVGVGAGGGGKGVVQIGLLSRKSNIGLSVHTYLARES